MTKCVYSSEEEACEYCALRKLKCVKVWGPKTRLAARTVVPAATHEQQQITQHSVSASQGSTTKVSEPSSQELLQRRPYPQFAPNGLKDGHTGIIYQHLNVNCLKIHVENPCRGSAGLSQNPWGPSPFGIPSRFKPQADKDMIAVIDARKIPRLRFPGLYGNSHDRHFNAAQFMHLDTLIENSSKIGYG